MSNSLGHSPEPINFMQTFVNSMGAVWQRERANSQMTLGSLIIRLAELPPEMEMWELSGAHSYRGYYEDLAFDIVRSIEKRTVRENIAYCKELLGQVFEGYKGGDYTMNTGTPVWFSHYGSCGLKIKEIKDDGSLVLEEDND